MKTLYLSIALFISPLLSFSQGNNATKNDPEAIKLLDAVSAKFKTFSTVQASFTYKVENASGKALSSQTGTVIMKGTKYKVNFAGQEIFSDGKTVWNYDKSANEVSINTLDASSGMITPQKLFTNFYGKDFYSVLNGEKKVGTVSLQEVEMTPVDKSKAFHKIYLLINKATKTIHSTKVLENDGSRYSYAVSNMKTNQAIADNTFAFDKSKYPGVEVIDLR